MQIVNNDQLFCLTVDCRCWLGCCFIPFCVDVLSDCLLTVVYLLTVGVGWAVVLSRSVLMAVRMSSTPVRAVVKMSDVTTDCKQQQKKTDNRQQETTTTNKNRTYRERSCIDT